MKPPIRVLGSFLFAPLVPGLFSTRLALLLENPLDAILELVSPIEVEHPTALKTP